jgi:hypothetical protein
VSAYSARMPRCVRALRAALEEFLSGEEAARAQRLRDPSEDLEPRGRERGRWLASEAAREALEEAFESHALDEEEALWLRRQVEAVRHRLAVLAADARLRAALVRATLASGEPLDLPARLARLSCADDGRRRADGARELEHALRPIALEHVTAHTRAELPLRVARPVQAAAGGPAPSTRPGGLLIASAFSVESMSEPAPRDLPEEPWLASAAAFLGQTDAAAEDAVRHCVRASHPGKLVDWHLLLRGLRAPELDSTSGRKQRWQRAAAWLRGLGFERELQTRMRAEVDRGGALPVAQTIALAVPRDVRIAQIAIDYGVVSDVLACQGVGHALGLALRFAALPPELRWPEGASVEGAFGGLALQLWGERGHLVRVQGMSTAEAERVGRLSGTVALLWARAWVAIALASAGDADHAQAQLEALAVALGRALCCDLPPGIAGVLGANRVLARDRAQELLAGLALHGVLRERFDADWFRNPRSAELLRNACERGNALSAEGWCVELSTSLANAAARGVELVT